MLNNIAARRFFPEAFSRPENGQLHHFYNASCSGFAVVAYIVATIGCGDVHCCFVYGTARLAPLKTVSVSRLELTAATLAAKCDAIIRMELNVTAIKSFFWTDSITFLYMINNCTKLFPTFVANRLAKIEELSNPSQWNYVEWKLNPADGGNKGLTASEFANSRWIKGPELLYSPSSFWPKCPCLILELPAAFCVLNKSVASIVIQPQVTVQNKLDQYSSWHKLKCAIAWVKIEELFIETSRDSPKVTDSVRFGSM